MVHRAELVDRERLAVEAHPLLPVEDRASRRQLDGERHDAERDRQDDQAGGGGGHVEGPLGQRAEALQRDVVEVDDRDAVQVLDAGPQRDELQQVRDDLHVDQVAAPASITSSMRWCSSSGSAT